MNDNNDNNNNNHDVEVVDNDNGDNDNNNNNPPPPRLIQDIDSWLESNGLRDAEEELQPDTGVLQHNEDSARVNEHAEYEQSVHDRVFQEYKQEEKENLVKRQKLLESMDGIKLDIRTANGGTILDVPIRPLAESCDTILTFVQSSAYWSSCSHHDKKKKTKTTNMTFSLEEYTKSSVQEFLNVVLSSYNDDSTTSTRRHTHTVNDIISSNALVDCCLIAHYLCAETILQQIVDIFIASIDTDNCYFLCQLADKLNLPLLFERSLGHMMGSMGELQDNQDVWDHLTPELQERIEAIKYAIESSIHGGSTQSRLYFSSLDEYIAIFAERVQYYKERLAEAKEQLDESVKGSQAWIYTKEKISHQEQRVRTLEIALSEQKKLFTNSKKLMRRGV